MKAVDRPKYQQIKYPRNTPRISRKRLWMDRSEWRKDPQGTLEGSQNIIDQSMTAQRQLGTMENQNYEGLPDAMERAGRMGIRKM